jgi:diguanylate cyclase (GGDEF)-like protein/PAS domain S-box-containing protein
MPLILVVDDEPDICRILARVLEMQGYETRMATSAGQALMLGESERPAVVLLDYMMPRMDGLHVLGRLREVSPASVVVVITGQGDERVAARLMKMGAYDYLTKPLDVPHLLRVVREACTVHRVRSEPHYQRLDASHRSLLAMHHRLGAVIEAIHEGLITFDQNQVIVEANPAAGRLLGVDHRTLPGKDRRSLLPHDPVPAAGQVVPNAETAVDLPDGRRIWLLRSAAEIRNDVGETVGGVETWLDITRIRELHREAMHKEEELVRAREALRSKRVLEAKNALLERRLMELGFLNRLGQRLAETVDIRRGGRIIADAFRQMFVAAQVEVTLRMHDGSEAITATAAATGSRIDPEVEAEGPSPEGPAPQDEPSVALHPLRELPAGSFRDRLADAGIGVVGLLRTGDCGGVSAQIRILAPEMVRDREMRKVLETAVTQIRSALTTMALYREKERLAITDGLTELHNHKYFIDRLAFEMARSSRFGRELSMILIDVDDFKGVNDRFGHTVGDQTLASLAGVIRGAVRKVDLAARYGGEEFVVLLPETGKRKALVSAERLRDAVERASVVPGGTPGGWRVTISAGVATFPADADSPADLVLRADRALYEAKAAGKNRVVAAASGRLKVGA